METDDLLHIQALSASNDLLFSSQHQAQCGAAYIIHRVTVRCRVLGSLLSAHLIMRDPLQPFGRLSQTDYDDELLHLANDLGTRLLTAFENTATGIPHPRVSLLSCFAARCYAQRGLCCRKMFVHLSVTRWYCVKTAKLLGSHSILETLWQYSNCDPPDGGIKFMGHEKSRFSTNISIFLGNDTRQGHSYYGIRI